MRFIKSVAFNLLIILNGMAAYNGPLPDFANNLNNKIKDFETGKDLTPKLPGQIFEFARPVPVDWNNDGVFDLIVGYNLRTPDSLRLVVFINQGSVGDPKFTGRSSSETCFFLKVKYPNENGFREFGSRGYHEGHSAHKWLTAIPNVIDWNGDGLFDLMVCENTQDGSPGGMGTGSNNLPRGEWLLVNTGSLGNPEFGKTANLTWKYYGQGISETEFPGISKYAERGDYLYMQVTLVDWNNDGVLDVNYPGIGGGTYPDFVLLGERSADGKWKPNGTWISHFFPSDVFPFITADFNNDGTNELICVVNQNWIDAGFHLYTSIKGSHGSYKYVADRPIFLPNQMGGFYGSDGILVKGWWCPKPSVIDFDEDGDPDILCGWGGGNNQGQYGDGIWYYPVSGGVAGSKPMYGTTQARMVWNRGTHPLAMSIAPFILETGLSK